MEQQTNNPYNAVGWFEIYVSDMPRAQKFYETVFELKLDNGQAPEGSDIEMATFPMIDNAPNSSGSLVKMDKVKPGGNSVIVYFSSLDCSVEEGRVAAAGGKVTQPKMSIGQHGFMSMCTDTEGNTFGIHSMK